MSKLTWNQCFAIINHFKLDDDEACRLLGFTHNALKLARELQKDANLFQPAEGMDFSYFKPYVDRLRKSTPSPESAQKANERTTQKPNNDTTQKPNIATEEKVDNGDNKEASNKRGRKTHKVKDAYEAIPYEDMKTPVEEFRLKYGVSLSVLRRHKHFDHKKELGQVTVRKVFLNRDDTEKVLCIWRQKPGADNQI